MQQNYLRNSQGCIAVYDITDRESFENLEEYLTEYFFYLEDEEEEKTPEHKTKSKHFKQF